MPENYEFWYGVVTAASVYTIALVPFICILYLSKGTKWRRRLGISD